MSIILLRETGEEKYQREIVNFGGGKNLQNSSSNVNEGPRRIKLQKLRETVA